MEAILQDFIRTLQLGEPRRFKNLEVFPLIPSRNGGPDFLTLKQALELMTRSTLDCALLDVRLGNDGTSFPAAERLAEQNIRWVFYTGDADASALRRDWPSCDVIFKPVQPKQLIAVIAASSRG